MKGGDVGKIWAGLAILFLTLPAGAVEFTGGSFSATIELLPDLELYSAELTLGMSFAGMLEVESESKIYSDGLRYQNFYLDGYIGDWDLWGKIYFHAQEVRYQKLWLNAALDLFGEELTLSFNHWASEDDYWSSDEDRFGPWPCREAISWDQAWRYFGSTISVEGPVKGYYQPSYLKLNIGQDYPDPDRFEIYIPSWAVDDFEAVFGDDFWVDWAASEQVICVTDTIEGYRWTSGGPRNEGYSVAQVYLTDPDDLSLGGCRGTAPTLDCPGQVIRWFEAHLHDGETLWIQGPVASITGPGTYYGYPNTYRVRIGGGSAAENRVEVIMPSHPGWSTEGPSFDQVVCVYGTITMHGDIAVIELPDLLETREGPCCSPAPLPFINFQVELEGNPFTLTLDFGDCCTGFYFRRLLLEVEDLPLCCGVTFDTSLTFTKEQGLTEFAVDIYDVFPICCGISFDINVTFTPESKTLSIYPEWEGITGCFELYGDVSWDPGDFVIEGLEIWGWGITCYLDAITLTMISALNPDEVEDIVDISFYSGEFEYLGLEYLGPGCCGGDVTFTAELWFGEDGVLFGLQRTRFYLGFPLAGNISAFLKMQLDLSDPTPLDWLDIGWDIDF
jgi:hypothetical protein